MESDPSTAAGDLSRDPEGDSPVLPELLYESDATVVTREIRDGRPVIVKQLKSRPYSRLRREFKMASQVEGAAVVRPLRLEESEETLALVFEDCGGCALSTIIAPGDHPYRQVSAFLGLASTLAGALRDVHRQGLIHHDLKPANIIVGAAPNAARLTDFGVATRREGEIGGRGVPVRGGTPAYMAPEQSGRMNRSVDHRADLYSLGVTFFEVLTGRRPFPDSEDPLVVMHHHIASQPVDPMSLDSRIPRAVADVVLKLLAKDAEDRYQTAAGLVADLELCAERLAAGTIASLPFIPGRNDVSERFLVSRKMFGRGESIERLRDAWRGAVAGEREFVLVHGFAGVGKSTLVMDMQRRILEQHGLFLTGKFDQYHGGLPYAAFQGVFRQLAAALLKEDRERLAKSKRELLSAVGPNGRILVDFAPEMERILGPQPALSPASPEDAEHRFVGVFRETLRVIAQAERPLFLFIDDLHWADAASLRLIRALALDSNLRHLMFTGAYRQDEVAPDHGLAVILRELEDAHIALRSVAVAELNLEDVVRIVAASLQADVAEVEELADFAHRKSGGNPFFLREFLESLHREGAIAYDADASRWSYEPDTIRRQNVPERVADLLARRMAGLAEPSRRILACAACAGNRFEPELIVAALGVSPEQADEWFEPALAAGLIAWSEQADDSLESPGLGVYMFSHDRVQQAAYDLAQTGERERMHVDLARALLERHGYVATENRPEVSDEIVFTVVHHIGRAGEFWRRTAGASPRDTAALYLRAGQRALASTAVQASADYLQAGVDCLGDSAWDDHYELYLTLHQNLAVAVFLCADLERSDRLVERILQCARQPLDQVAACEIRMAILAAGGQFARVVHTGLEALSLMGVHMPRNPGSARSLLSFLVSEARIRLRGTDSILRAEANKDPLACKRVDLLTQVMVAAYRSNRNLFLVVAAKAMDLTYRAGITPSAPLALGTHSTVLAALGFHHRAARFSEYMLALMPERAPLRASTYFIAGALVEHWIAPLEDSCEYLETGARVALQTGEVEYQGYNRFYKTVHRMYSVGDLREADADLTEQYQLAGRQHNANWLMLVRVYLQYVRDLRSPGLDPGKPGACEFFDHSAESPRLIQEEAWGVISLHSSARALVQFCLHSDEAALESIETAKRYDAYVGGMYFFSFCQYMEALVSLRVARASGSNSRRRALMQRGAKLIRVLGRRAKNNPRSYRHKLLLLQAEQAQARGRRRKASALYNAALEGASASRYALDEGLICWLAGDFYIEQGQSRVARSYIEDARTIYDRWGAAALVREIDSRYEALLSGEGVNPARGPAQARSELQATLAATGRGDFAHLDLDTLNRAARIFFAESDPATIRVEFLRLAMENAGARRGALILRRAGDDFWIEAILEAATGGATLPSVLYEESDLLPRELVHQALRTGAPVILGDAGEVVGPSHWYFERRRSKSILVAPIRHQGEAIGVLVLENELAIDVFSPERLRVLEVLAHQAALSLENARMYAGMKSEITEQSRELVDLKLARQRMDPHLLFNALNMIHALMRTEPERANRALFALGNLYSSLTKISERELVPMAEEWGFALDYLELMGFRYAKSLSFEIEAPDSLPGLGVPALCIQPLVENCFKHAFRGGGAAMRIRVTLRVNIDEIVVTVDDNGVGFSDARANAGGATLRSIDERVRHYLPRSVLEIENTEAGARARLRLRNEVHSD